MRINEITQMFNVESYKDTCTILRRGNDICDGGNEITNVVKLRKT